MRQLVISTSCHYQDDQIVAIDNLFFFVPKTAVSGPHDDEDSEESQLSISIRRKDYPNPGCRRFPPGTLSLCHSFSLYRPSALEVETIRRHLKEATRKPWTCVLRMFYTYLHFLGFYSRAWYLSRYVEIPTCRLQSHSQGDDGGTLNNNRIIHQA